MVIHPAVPDPLEESLRDNREEDPGGSAVHHPQDRMILEKLRYRKGQ